jgi:hypothetical protein
VHRANPRIALVRDVTLAQRLHHRFANFVERLHARWPALFEPDDVIRGRRPYRFRNFADGGKRKHRLCIGRRQILRCHERQRASLVGRHGIVGVLARDIRETRTRNHPPAGFPGAGKRRIVAAIRNFHGDIGQADFLRYTILFAIEVVDFACLGLEARFVRIERLRSVAFDALDFRGGKRALRIGVGIRGERGRPRAVGPGLRRKRLFDQQVIQHVLHPLRTGREFLAEVFRYAGERLVVIGARQIHPAIARQDVGREVGGQHGERARQRGKRKQNPEE